MAVTITTVPETITRADYLRLIESVGFDVTDLQELRFGVASIEAVVFARDAEGKRYAEGDEVATHHVRIWVGP